MCLQQLMQVGSPVLFPFKASGSFSTENTLTEKGQEGHSYVVLLAPLLVLLVICKGTKLGSWGKLHSVHMPEEE